jgi:hypothetical protein
MLLHKLSDAIPPVNRRQDREEAIEQIVVDMNLGKQTVSVLVLFVVPFRLDILKELGLAWFEKVEVLK